MAGRKGAHALGPASNPRQGGGTPRQRQPRLMRNRTAAWRAELGLSSSIMGLFDSRSPSGWEKGSLHIRDLCRIQGRVESAAQANAGWTAARQAELGAFRHSFGAFSTRDCPWDWEKGGPAHRT